MTNSGNKITRSTPIIYAGEHKKSFTWVVAILAALGTYFAVWDRLGWVTIPAYAQDHEAPSMKEQQATIITMLQSQKIAVELLQKGQDDNQDQWECDETGEELTDLRHELASDMTTEDRVDANILKDRLDEVWRTKRCTRFID